MRIFAMFVTDSLSFFHSVKSACACVVSRHKYVDNIKMCKTYFRFWTYILLRPLSWKNVAKVHAIKRTHLVLI